MESTINCIKLYMINFRIMFSCSHLNIETPSKSPGHEAHLETNSCFKRFKPSSAIRNLLKQVDRIHSFTSHTPFTFIKLEKISFTYKGGELICDWAREHNIPDVVKSFEATAMSNQFYDEDVCHYISEEFNCNTHYAFAIISVFTYMKIYSVDIDTALNEIFILSTHDFVCNTCTGGSQSVQESNERVEEHNVMMLNRISGLWDDDDSYKDPTCNLEIDDCRDSISSESSEDSYKNREISIETKSVVYNPFLDSSDSDVETGDNYVFNPLLNSTAADQSSSISIKLPSKRNPVPCTYCPRLFSNRYNMKMHIIRYGQWIKNKFAHLF